MRQRIWSLVTAGLALAFVSSGLAAEKPTGAPDFGEVYNLVRQHLKGVSEAELNRTAVQALIRSLGPKVELVGADASTVPVMGLVSKANLFGRDIAYLRVTRVERGLAQALSSALHRLAPSNSLIGVVLDLRYAGGYDYAAAMQVADLFVTKERPLLDWGQGVVSSKPRPDGIRLPVMVLVNKQTSGAAEALGAILREGGVGLLLGGRTAGEALAGTDYPLSDGSRLRIATHSVHLADGSEVSQEGVQPDIAVQVSPQDERAYFADAFKELAKTNRLAASSSPSQVNGTNHIRRIVFNEAELVREHREGLDPEAELAEAVPEKPDKPVVRDPVLARALDVLKGLAVVRHSRS